VRQANKWPLRIEIGTLTTRLSKVKRIGCNKYARFSANLMHARYILAAMIQSSKRQGGPMNIYLSCSITGGRQDEGVYQALVESLLADGHTVPTAVLASPEVMVEEARISPREVYLRDEAWVRECDVVIAEVSTPSHGVGYEIALGILLGKPVLCLHHNGRKVSKMITGNTSPNIKVVAYLNSQQAVASMRAFLITLK
jgi:2'-deoxynucleoside 5'-phosphate N-hydrolase